MPMVEKGIYNSVFDKTLGKGSTYDALVYPLQLALYLLGKVKSVKAVATKLPNGVNLANYVILTHENNTITTINCSKGVTSYAPSEFIGHDSSITIDKVHPLTGIKVYNKDGVKEYSDDTNISTLMTYELKDFADEKFIFNTISIENDLKTIKAQRVFKIKDRVLEYELNMSTHQNEHFENHLKARLDRF